MTWWAAADRRKKDWGLFYGVLRRRWIGRDKPLDEWSGSSRRCLLDPNDVLPALPQATMREKIGIRAWGKITQCELWDRGSWSTSICAVGAGRVHLLQNPPLQSPQMVTRFSTLSVGSGLRLRRRRRSASAASSHWAAPPNDGLPHHAAGWMRRSAQRMRADPDGSARRLRLLKLGRDGTSTSAARTRTGSPGGGEASLS